MDIIFLALILVSIILFILGLSQIIGLGWALFIFDLITHNTPSDYYFAQKSYSKTKGIRKKVVGLSLIVFAIILFLFSGSKL